MRETSVIIVRQNRQVLKVLLAPSLFLPCISICVSSSCPLAMELLRLGVHQTTGWPLEAYFSK